MRLDSCLVAQLRRCTRKQSSLCESDCTWAAAFQSCTTSQTPRNTCTNFVHTTCPCGYGLQVSPEFKAKVMQLLTAGGFEEQRSSKMGQEELLALLAAFNTAGIHFA